MAEEQKWQEPDAHRLCANNCGFFGSPTTLNLCSKCYKEHCVKEQRASTAKIAVEKSLSPLASSSPSSSSSSSLSESFSLDRLISPENPVASIEISGPVEEVEAPPVPTQPNRCGTCRKRVGLTGFKCKCGATYCGSHRYPEEHACTFDFKALGKEAIARANPVVVAEKLNKI